MIQVKKRYAVILSIISAIYSCLLLTIPLLTSHLVDTALAVADKSKELKELLWVIFFLGIVTIAEIGIYFLEKFLYYHFYIRLEKEYNEFLYEELLKKDVLSLSSYHSAKIEQLFTTDVTNLISRDLDTIPTVVKQITRFLLALIILIFIDWRFLILIVLCGLFGFGMAKIYSKILRKRHKEVLESTSKMNGFVIESNTQIKMIKSYDAEKTAAKHFKSLDELQLEKKKKRNSVLIIANTGLFAFSNLAYLFALGYGAYAIATSFLTYGSMLALVQLFSHIQAPLLAFSNLLNHFSLAKASSLRIKDLVALNTEEEQLVFKSFNKIILEDVCFSYDQERSVIDHLSFEINPQDIIHLKGPSGIGKTTLFMLLLGFLKPNSGSMMVECEDISYLVGGATRGLFAYVPQENVLFSGSILDNFYILTSKDENEIIEALKMVFVYDELLELPKGLNTMLHERGSGLSLGQIQRILIAIAILSDRPILLLDEYSSALDIENEKKIVENLSSLGKTIIYITHRSELLAEDKTISLENK